MKSCYFKHYEKNKPDNQRLWRCNQKIHLDIRVLKDLLSGLKSTLFQGSLIPPSKSTKSPFVTIVIFCVFDIPLWWYMLLMLICWCFESRKKNWFELVNFLKLCNCFPFYTRVSFVKDFSGNLCISRGTDQLLDWGDAVLMPIDGIRLESRGYFKISPDGVKKAGVVAVGERPPPMTGRWRAVFACSLFELSTRLYFACCYCLGYLAVFVCNLWIVRDYNTRFLVGLHSGRITLVFVCLCKLFEWFVEIGSPLALTARLYHLIISKPWYSRCLFFISQLFVLIFFYLCLWLHIQFCFPFKYSLSFR